MGGFRSLQLARHQQSGYLLPRMDGQEPAGRHVPDRRRHRPFLGVLDRPDGLRKPLLRPGGRPRLGEGNQR